MNKCSLTLDEARAIMADESQPEILRAAANTIISLYQAIANLEFELNYNREALR